MPAPTRAGSPRSVEKRGMLLHMVGMAGRATPSAWPAWLVPYTDPVPESYYQHVAEVNGKRELWGGIPLNTNLAMATRRRADRGPRCRRLRGGAPEVDIVHPGWRTEHKPVRVPLCRDHLPSDLYVKLCNEVDAELTRARY